MSFVHTIHTINNIGYIHVYNYTVIMHIHEVQVNVHVPAMTALVEATAGIMCFTTPAIWRDGGNFSVNTI